MPGPLDLPPLTSMAGHLLRRAQQHHTTVWAEVVGPEPTGPQYAVLAAVEAEPGCDQRRVGTLASLDRTSTAQVVGRLAQRGRLARSVDPADGRRDVLTLTEAADLGPLHARVRTVQDRLLAPLDAPAAEALVRDLADVARVTGDPALAGSPAPLRIPGHLLRRAQQVHTALLGEALDGDLTGPQYAALHALATHEALSQRALGDLTGLDRSTTADLVARLERRGWLVRHRDPADARRRVLTLTDEAVEGVRTRTPSVLQVQAALVDPVPAERRPALLDSLRAVARLTH